MKLCNGQMVSAALTWTWIDSPQRLVLLHFPLLAPLIEFLRWVALRWRCDVFWKHFSWTDSVGWRESANVSRGWSPRFLLPWSIGLHAKITNDGNRDYRAKQQNAEKNPVEDWHLMATRTNYESHWLCMIDEASIGRVADACWVLKS